MPKSIRSAFALALWVIAALSLPVNARGDEATDPRWLSPAPGRVGLLVDSEGATLEVSVAFTADGEAVAVRCFTPCTLFVPPGLVELTYGVADVVPRTENLTLGDAGAHLSLRPPSLRWQPEAAPKPKAAPPSNTPAILTSIGLMAGTIGVAATVSSLAYLGTGQTLYGDTRRNVYITLGVGPVLAAAGVVLLVLGRTR